MQLLAIELKEISTNYKDLKEEIVYNCKKIHATSNN